jgi:cytosine/adenosine deaminase-related metal-dependent hydrolase
MQCVSGIIYDPETEPYKGYICWDDGIVTEVGAGSPPIEPDAKGIIVPLFINGHVHIGDSCFHGKVDPSLGLHRIVVPPHGLKHRLLANTPKDELIHGIRQSLGTMAATGTGSFLDFREGGLKGIELLEEACRSPISDLNSEPIGEPFPASRPEAHIFSRPAKNLYDPVEVSHLLERSSGLGISAMADWEYAELQKVAADVRASGKLIAMHASEAIREDIDAILELKPDILVHLTSATASDLERVADADVRVIVCPRTNSLFGLWPDIPKMFALGIPLTFGTDNLMFTQPDMFKEMRFTFEKLHRLSGLSGSEKRKQIAHDVVRMTGVSLRKPLNVKSGLLAGEKARFMMLPVHLKDHASVADRIIHEGSKPLMVVQE